MQEYQYFKKSGNPEINAALVGISKEDWLCARPGTTKVDAIKIMEQYQFDILPQINKSNIVKSYYFTIRWGVYNDNNILCKPIEEADKIYYLTNIVDVIRLMYENKRNFYFLTNHSEIVGLITISNLNCKNVSLYYYNLINTIERKLGHFVRKYLDTASIIESLQKIGKRKSTTYALDSITRFVEDSQKGLDGSIIEYLYLSELFLLIIEHKLYKKLDYKNQNAFEENSGKLRQLRNTISHPNKSLIKNTQSLNDLWYSSLKIKELDEKLSN